MKDTINESQFVDEMSKKQHGFSYEGAKALFEHLTQYEEDCDKELEFREDEKLDEDIEPDFDHAFTLDCPNDDCQSCVIVYRARSV